MIKMLYGDFEQTINDHIYPQWPYRMQERPFNYYGFSVALWHAPVCNNADSHNWW